MALQEISDVIKANSRSVGGESDAELQRALRRELAEIVLTRGICDPDVLLDMVLAGAKAPDARRTL